MSNRERRGRRAEHIERTRLRWAWKRFCASPVDRAQRAVLAAQNDDRPSAATQHDDRILDLLDRALLGSW